MYMLRNESLHYYWGRRLTKLAHAIKRELAFQSALAMGRSAPNPPVACVLLLFDMKRKSRSAPASFLVSDRAYFMKLQTRLSSLSCPPDLSAKLSAALAFFWHKLGWIRPALPLFVSGATEVYGRRHAEIVCLDHYDRLIAKKQLRSLQARLYLSLEPCTHYGRTGPCAERISQYSQITKLCIWERDPALKVSSLDFPYAAQRRSSLLLPTKKTLGTTALGASFLGGFFKRIHSMGPRLHLKLACTQESVMALRSTRLRISRKAALAFGHLLRAKCDAVLVGMGSIVQDRPRLALSVQQIQEGAAYLEKARPCAQKTDLFCDTLLTNARRLASHIAKEEQAFQPDRLFLLGRPDAAFSCFREIQKKLSQSTGKAALCFVTEPYQDFWSNLLRKEKALKIAALLPPLQHNNFAPALLHVLAERKYNEVLIEGGATLLLRIQEILSPHDRFYILRSNYDLAHIKEAGKPAPQEKVYVPAFLQEQSPLVSYELGEDRLETGSLYQSVLKPAI